MEDREATPMEHELVIGTTLASSEWVQEVSPGSTSQLWEEVTNLAKSNTFMNIEMTTHTMHDFFRFR